MREGDLIEILIDRNALHGTVNLIGEGTQQFGADEGARRLAARTPREGPCPAPFLTGRYSALGRVGSGSGGVWGGLHL